MKKTSLIRKNVEELLRYYEKQFFKLQYENATINRFNIDQNEAEELLKIIRVLKYYLQNNCPFISVGNSNRLQSLL